MLLTRCLNVRVWQIAAEVGRHQILPVPNEQRTYDALVLGVLEMIPASRKAAHARSPTTYCAIVPFGGV